jgi:hypothetical protein
MTGAETSIGSARTKREVRKSMAPVCHRRHETAVRAGVGRKTPKKV